jgi:hypothetical protein
MTSENLYIYGTENNNQCTTRRTCTSPKTMVHSPTQKTQKNGFDNGEYVGSMVADDHAHEKRHISGAPHKLSYEAPQWFGEVNRGGEKNIHPSHAKPSTTVSSSMPEWMTIPQVPVKGNQGRSHDVTKRRGRDSIVQYNPVTFSKIADVGTSVYEQAQERSDHLLNSRPNRPPQDMVALIRDNLIKRCKASGQSAYMHQMFRSTLRLFRKFDVDMSGMCI